METQRKRKVWWDGKRGAGKYSHISVKTSVKRNGDRTEPSSSPGEQMYTRYSGLSEKRIKRRIRSRYE
jgi:hypothetical protein